jgi:hypothetical protein
MREKGVAWLMDKDWWYRHNMVQNAALRLLYYVPWTAVHRTSINACADVGHSDVRHNRNTRPILPIWTRLHDPENELI